LNSLLFPKVPQTKSNLIKLRLGAASAPLFRGAGKRFAARFYGSFWSKNVAPSRNQSRSVGHIFKRSFFAVCSPSRIQRPCPPPRAFIPLPLIPLTSFFLLGRAAALDMLCFPTYIGVCRAKGPLFEMGIDGPRRASTSPFGAITCFAFEP